MFRVTAMAVTHIAREKNSLDHTWFTKASWTVVLLSLLMSVVFASSPRRLYMDLLPLVMPVSFLGSGMCLLLLDEAEILRLSFHLTYGSNSLNLPFLAQQKGKCAPSLLLLALTTKGTGALPFLALSPAIFMFLQIGMVCKWYWVLLINAFHGKSIFNTFTSQS